MLSFPINFGCAFAFSFAFASQFPVHFPHFPCHEIPSSARFVASHIESHFKPAHEGFISNDGFLADGHGYHSGAGQHLNEFAHDSFNSDAHYCFHSYG